MREPGSEQERFHEKMWFVMQYGTRTKMRARGGVALCGGEGGTVCELFVRVGLRVL
jgi:hypothetical protein